MKKRRSSESKKKQESDPRVFAVLDGKEASVSDDTEMVVRPQSRPWGSSSQLLL